MTRIRSFLRKRSLIQRYFIGLGALLLVVVPLAITLSAETVNRVAYPDSPFPPYPPRTRLKRLQDLANLEGTIARQAMQAYLKGKYVRARVLSQKLLDKHPESRVARWVLANAMAFGETNLPRGLYGIRQLRFRLEAEGKNSPDDQTAREWYYRTLKTEYVILGALDRRAEQIKVADRLEELGFLGAYYKIWALMKLHRWEEADEAIRIVSRQRNRRVKLRALNGKCALEFEKGDRLAGYAACYRMVQQFKTSAVAWSNFGGAALLVLKFGESEEGYLRSTREKLDFAGTPWRRLAGLYLAQGRIPEVLAALKKARAQRMTRDPHTLQQDEAKMTSLLAAFLLATGRNEDAERVARRIYERPDRAGSSSSSPEVLELEVRILMFAVLRSRLAQLDEQQAARSWLRKWLPSSRRKKLQWEIWTMRQRMWKLLANRRRLIEILRPYIAGPAPWIGSTLLQVMPPGIALEALNLAQKKEGLRMIVPYYDGMRAEVLLRLGREEACLAAAKRALAGLSKSAEKLFRARIAAIASMAAQRLGDFKAQMAYLSPVLRDFPAVLRLLGARIPASIEPDDSSGARRLAAMLRRSALYEVNSAGFVVKITSSGGKLNVEVLLKNRTRHIEMTIALPKAGTDDDWLAVFRKFHDKLMSPYLDLNQTEINSLDGSPQTDKLRKNIDNILKL